METIYSLHNFMLLTKGYEYLIAVGFLMLFTLFYLWLNGKPHKKKITNEASRDAAGITTRSSD